MHTEYMPVTNVSVKIGSVEEGSIRMSLLWETGKSKKMFQNIEMYIILIFIEYDYKSKRRYYEANFFHKRLIVMVSGILKFPKCRSWLYNSYIEDFLMVI